MATMITSSVSAPATTIGGAATHTGNVSITTQHQQNVEYFMSYAAPNLLTIQEVIGNDVIAQVGEDAIKKRIKADIASKLAEEIVASKVTFTAQENYAEHTRIIRAKTYVFTQEQLKSFIEKCIK